MTRLPTLFHPFLIGGLFAASVACAQPTAIPVEAKQRILQTAAEAVMAGAITEAEYREVVRWTTAEPCKAVQTTLTEGRRTAIAHAVSTMQGFPNSHVLGYFATRGWSIVYTDASPGDEQYLVYDRDPVGRVKPRTSWSGAATVFETTEIRDWLQAAAPTIPKRLADCFAWQVTLGR